MKCLHMSERELPEYIGKQLGNFFPLLRTGSLKAIGAYVPEALHRVGRCIDEISMWKSGQFDVLHSSQYCTFLYYLTNSIWRAEGPLDVCASLFGLNKALNGIDLYYEIQMPEVFFIGHSVGIVLAKASYGNFLVLYQGVTVGKNHGLSPMLDDGVILYPNASVLGDSRVGRGAVISQGVSIVDDHVPSSRIAYRGAGRELIMRTPPRSLHVDFFRNYVP